MDFLVCFFNCLLKINNILFSILKFLEYFGNIMDIVIMNDPLGHAFITFSNKIDSELSIEFKHYLCK
jgi:hypothetical protein